MTRAFCFGLALVLFAAVVPSQFVKAQSNVTSTRIDLTHPFDETTIYWPTEEGFELLRGPAGVTEGGYYYAANRFMCAEHGGTHTFRLSRGARRNTQGFSSRVQYP